MPAVCAVCLEPIVRGDKFMAVGTEVIHQQCVVGKTQGTRQRLQIIDLQHDLAQLRIQLDEQTKRNARLYAEAERLIVEHAEYRRDRADRLTREIAIKDDYREQRDTARRERDALRGELELARRELLAVRSAPVLPVPVAPVATPAPEPVKDERDASEIRFSLLDLD